MVKKQTIESLAKIEFSVPGMLCDGCAQMIRSTLTAVPGVHEVKPKLWRKRVEVRYEPAAVQEIQLRTVLAAAGFEATHV